MRCKLKGFKGQARALETFLLDSSVSSCLSGSSHSPSAQKAILIKWAQEGREVNIEVPLERVLAKLDEAIAAGLRFRPPGFPKATAVKDPAALRQAFTSQLEGAGVSLARTLW